MSYTPIVEADKIKDAVERLRSTIKSECSSERTHGDDTVYVHPDEEIWTSFGERGNRYRIAFGHGPGHTQSAFQANPPKEGSSGSKGLFVVDEKKRRHLVHTGYFNVSPGHPHSKRRVQAFQEFTRDREDCCWVDVEGKGRDFWSPR